MACRTGTVASGWLFLGLLAFTSAVVLQRGPSDEPRSGASTGKFLPVVDCSGEADQIVEIRVNNTGQNWLKVETCSAPDGFSCKADSFFPYNECAEWLQPSSLVRLLFPRNTTYMALVYCVHNLQSIHCLQQPDAVEVEGPAWPFQEDVPYASRDTAYCSDNLDCPMSYCQVGHSPPTCRV